jgi:hypothetical protein
MTLAFDAVRLAEFDAADRFVADAVGRLDYFPDFGLGWDHR